LSNYNADARGSAFLKLNFNPQNILIIDFGQLGDVVLSLPALRAVRQKFPEAKITAMVGKSCAAVIDLCGYVDDKIVVDRVRLRDGAKILSVWKIFNLVRDVRRRKFDFIIDLHSLSETNWLGYLSGAEKRLYARRENRSLDFLANLTPPKEDRSKHATDRYLDVLKPLNIENASREAMIIPHAQDIKTVEKMFRHRRETDDKSLFVGLFPGAGHPSRRWSLDNFVSLADFLARNDKVKIAVFLGPEEKNLTPEIKVKFPPETVIFDKLTIPQLVAAQSLLSVFVANDTGPMHLAAAVGTPVVLLIDERAPKTYKPLTKSLRTVESGKIDEISVEEVYAAVRELLTQNRIGNLIFDF
jgi:ADP-heptose:LPS heptosyltransferase